MTESELDLVNSLRKLVDDAIAGRIAVTMSPPGDVAPELQALTESLVKLLVNLEAMQRFSVALANGEIATDAPPRNILLGPLKSLQASLRHLTWQTQEVASGHLDHRVDFLGEFSIAFNQMIDALQMKQRAEHEAMEATRLAGIGQLAAGVAHEINTPLQYIGTNLEFVRDGLLEWQAVGQAALVLADQVQTSGEPAEIATSLQKSIVELEKNIPLGEMQEAVQDTLIGTARIAKIVTAVKNFTTVGRAGKSLVDINHIIEDTLEVSRNAWSQAAECILALDPFLPQILCRADDINQVLLNLILNAVQAIEECGKPLPGRITVSTRREGNHVVICIADSGPGIPEAIKNQIFNLFFTTRDVGKGTGLGLALVHDIIVTKHGGVIEVGGQEGEGAVFTLRLPILASKSDSYVPS
jgi:signal transduction histidine kinase